MKRPGQDIPPLFHDLPDAPPAGERNVLEEVPGHLLSPQRQTYEVAEELRLLIIITCCFAGLTTWVFPILPDSVDVGGWALWWLGGAITTVMEFVARYWLIEVVLGGLFLLCALYLVIASHGLSKATKTEQLLMYGSVVLIIPNFLALLSILVLWLAVILIWAIIICIPIAIVGLIIEGMGAGR
jgi:hypothetical protein